MTDEILAANKWSSNADLIADIARLGYISDNCLDMTYGLGIFWKKHVPRFLVANDRYTKADHNYNYEALPPEWHDTFGTVVFDPPYKLNGTASGEDARYGVHRQATVYERFESIAKGLLSGSKVVCPNGYFIIKVMDQVASGKVHWQGDLVRDVLYATGEFNKVGEFHFLNKPRPQPSGRAQIHERRNYSTLLIFQKSKKQDWMNKQWHQWAKDQIRATL